LGIEVEQINSPWPTSTNMLNAIAEKGGTHAEPGHGIMGTTPWHVFADLPEIPAWVYVTEVSHTFEDFAMVYGGGMGIGVDFPTFMFGAPKFMSTYKMRALIGSDPDTITRSENIAVREPYPAEFTDYYSMLRPGPTKRVRDGDSAVYAFRPQIFVTRASVAVVEGIQRGRPKVLGIFDRAANLIDDRGRPRPDAEVFELMKKV
jgi:predicted amino acid racemase